MNKKLTKAEIASKLGISFWQLYDFMHRYNINRRKHSEANYDKKLIGIIKNWLDEYSVLWAGS